MANSNFVVQNGLTVGPLTIFSGNGDVITTGNVSASGTLPEAFSSLTVYGTVTAGTVNAGTIGNVGASHIGSTGYIGTINSSTINAATIGNTGAAITANSISSPVQLYLTSATSNVGVVNVGGNINYGPDFGLLASFVGNIPNYAYVAVQNLNTGGNASTSFTAYNNTGTSYVDVGVNSSNFNAVASGYVNNSVNAPNASYAYAYGGDMVIGTWGNNGLHFITSAATVAGDSMFIAGNGNVYISGNLAVSGTQTVFNTITNLTTETANSIQVSYISGNSTVNSGVITLQNNIVPNANTAINLGSSSTWFNTIYGTAIHAQYADLAENYQADKFYNPGTVLMFGGTNEVTIADADTTRVAGVVSTNPATLMNGGLTGSNVVALALTGRVPCNVIGPVAKGDLMVSAGFGYAKVNNTPAVGQVIGKALADFPVVAKGVIEVVIGRF
jgi:hypothetical protein